MSEQQQSVRQLISEEVRTQLPLVLLELIAMLGLVVLATQVIAEFPTLDPNPPALFVLWGIVSLFAFVPLALARRKLMPWGSQAPLMMWGSLVAFAALGGFLVSAFTSFGNGILDRSPPHQVPYKILGGSKYGGDHFLRVAPASAPGEASPSTYSVLVPERDWEAATEGSVLVVDIRPGFFGMPWIAGHRLCQPDESSC